MEQASHGKLALRSLMTIVLSSLHSKAKKINMCASGDIGLAEKGIFFYFFVFFIFMIDRLVDKKNAATPK